MKSIFTLVLTFLSISIVSAQSNAVFGYQTTDGYPANIVALIEGDNNHFYAIANDNATYISTLIKSDQNGNIIWQKQLQLADAGNLFQAIQVSYHNGYIYVLGHSQFMSSLFNYPLAKMDINGNLVWSRILTPIDNYTYHNPSLDFGSSGDIIVASSTFSRFELFSLNEDGSSNWVRNCSSDSTEYKNPNFDITCCENGDVMGCCKAGSDMCFYRMSPSGTPLWSKRILEMDNAYTHTKSIRQINTNTFVACGYRAPNMMIFDYRGFYTLLDGSGNFISFNLVNEMAEIKNIFPLDNGNFMLEGTSYGDYQYALIEINSSGTIINSHKTALSQQSPASYEAIADINGNLFIGDGYYVQKMSSIGPTECFNYSTTTFTLTGDDPSTDPTVDYFVLHPGTGTITNSTGAYLDPGTLVVVYGCELSGIQNPIAGNIRVYPTLLSNNESIFIEHEMTNEVQYSIMDLNGKMVAQNVLANNSVSINGMSAGMYVLQLTNNGNVVYHSKFVVN